MDRIPWEIADLIVARLGNTITEEQQKELDEWIGASPQHRVLYEKAVKLDSYDLYRQAVRGHQYEARYKEFCRYAGQRERRRWTGRIRWAAVILLPLMALGWWYSQRQQTELLPQEYFAPGSYQALLTVPGGETYRLARGTREGRLKKTNAYVKGDTLNYVSRGNAENGVYHRLIIPRGGEYMLKLSDGTQVWLNAESELYYPVVFGETERKVMLKGEAYFQVTSDSLHPFVVETGGQKLTVLGTSFGIRSYQEEKRILTTLETGKVEIEAEGRQVILKPGEQSRYEPGSLSVKTVNTALYTAWHKGKFIFSDQPLEEILNTLARWYNIEVEYRTEEIKKIRVNGELPRYGDVREFLMKIELLEKARFNVNGKTVTVLKY